MATKIDKEAKLLKKLKKLGLVKKNASTYKHKQTQSSHKQKQSQIVNIHLGGSKQKRQAIKSSYVPSSSMQAIQHLTYQQHLAQQSNTSRERAADIQREFRNVVPEPLYRNMVSYPSRGIRQTSNIEEAQIDRTIPSASESFGKGIGGGAFALDDSSGIIEHPAELTPQLASEGEIGSLSVAGVSRQIGASGYVGERQVVHKLSKEEPAAGGEVLPNIIKGRKPNRPKEIIAAEKAAKEERRLAREKAAIERLRQPEKKNKSEKRHY